MNGQKLRDGFAEYGNPGSDEARKAGCTCPSNNGGKGRRLNDDGLVFDVDVKCPIGWHRKLPEYAF